jgi:hypothetical protein
MQTMESDEPLPRWTWLAVVGAVAITASLCGYIILGAPAAAVWALGAGLAVVGWRATTYRARFDVRAATIPMVLSTISLMALIAEGYLGQMPARVRALAPALFPAGTSFDDRGYVAALYALVALFTFGAYAAWRRHPLGEYAAWLVFCLGGAAALGHLVLPWFSGGGLHYFPGALMSPLVLGLGLMGIRRLVVDHRSAVKGG